MPGQHRRGHRQGGGVEAALGRVAVAPAVGGDHAVGRTVVGPDEAGVLGLGVHGRAEGCRGLGPAGPLRLERGLDVTDTGEVGRLLEALPGPGRPGPVTGDRVEQPGVGLETARHHRQDAAPRLGFHRAQPLTPVEVGHPRESFRHAVIVHLWPAPSLLPRCPRYTRFLQAVHLTFPGGGADVLYSGP